MKAKNLFLILMSLVTIGSFSACGNLQSRISDSSKVSDSGVSEKNIENTQIANPWTDCDTMSDAIEKAGFSFDVPEEIKGYSDMEIQVLDEEIIQVIYQEKKDSDNEIIIRKGKGAKDISGDYNEYDSVKKTEINGCEVVEKGDGQKVMSATWQSAGYTYSLSSNGIGEQELEDLIQQVK